MSKENEEENFFDKKQMINRILSQYGKSAQSFRQMTTGVGGDTFEVTCGSEGFILKISDRNSMNRPEAEPAICEFLSARNFPVSCFHRTTDGGFYGTLSDGRVFHLQDKISGRFFSMNEAPEFLMREMPKMLSKLHLALMDYEPLPEGISENFFRVMTPEHARASYESSIQKVKEREEKSFSENDGQLLDDLEFRLALMDRIKPFLPDFQKLTVLNTHGDFTINQILCSTSGIEGIIDWTTACRHPIVWELTRSFFYAEPSCRDGKLDKVKFDEYIASYEAILPLTPYDREMLLPVYMYQLAVCDYYAQYLSTEGDKAAEYLLQATFATKVLQKQEQYLV